LIICLSILAIFILNFSSRINEFLFHLNKISVNSIVNYFFSFLLIANKIFKLFLPFLLFCLFINYLNFKNYFLRPYIILFGIYCLPLLATNYLYFLNIQITSSRYFIPILLISMPLFTLILYSIVNNSRHLIKIIFFIYVTTCFFININKNYQYKSSAILDFKKYLSENNIYIHDVFFEDKRLLFYINSEIDIENKIEFNSNLYCSSNYKFYLISLNQFDAVKNFNNFSIITDPLIHNKYKFLKKINDCKNNN